MQAAGREQEDVCGSSRSNGCSGRCRCNPKDGLEKGRRFSTTRVARIRGSVAEQHDLRHRQRVRMGDRHERSGDFHARGAKRGAAVQLQARWAGMPDDLDVLPQDAVGLARAERFHRGFLDREAARQVRSRIPSLGTIGDLTGREHTVQEALAVAFEQLRDSGNVGGVEADAEDVHDRTTA
jgi:hypothetical protein